MKAVVFDLDGTLLDSIDVWHQIDIDFLKNHGIEDMGDYSEKVLGVPFLEAAAYTIERFHLNMTIGEVVDEWMNMAIESYSYYVQLKPGARDYLEKLVRDGVHLGIATSCDPSLYKPCLKHHGIDHLFECILETNHHQVSKNNPETYTYFPKYWNIDAKDCLYYDDLYEALYAAHQCGMEVIGVADEFSRQFWKQDFDYQVITDFREV